MIPELQKLVRVSNFVVGGRPVGDNTMRDANAALPSPQTERVFLCHQQGEVTMFEVKSDPLKVSFEALERQDEDVAELREELPLRRAKPRFTLI